MRRESGEFTCTEQDHRRVKGQKQKGGGEVRTPSPYHHRDSVSGNEPETHREFGIEPFQPVSQESL